MKNGKRFAASALETEMREANEFAMGNNLKIVNTFFDQHPRRLFTWTSPSENYRNQLDYILVPNRWKTPVMNAKTLQGADCGSAHELICPCMDAYQTEEKSERKTCIEIRRQQHL